MIDAILRYILKQPTTPPRPDTIPAAWSYELAHAVDPNTGEGTEWHLYITPYRPNVPDKLIRNLHPLYKLEKYDAVDS